MQVRRGDLTRSHTSPPTPSTPTVWGRVPPQRLKDPCHNPPHRPHPLYRGAHRPSARRNPVTNPHTSHTYRLGTHAAPAPAAQQRLPPLRSGSSHGRVLPRRRCSQQRGRRGAAVGGNLKDIGFPGVEGVRQRVAGILVEVEGLHFAGRVAWLAICCRGLLRYCGTSSQWRGISLQGCGIPLRCRGISLRGCGIPVWRRGISLRGCGIPMRCRGISLRGCGIPLRCRGISLQDSEGHAEGRRDAHARTYAHARLLRVSFFGTRARLEPCVECGAVPRSHLSCDTRDGPSDVHRSTQDLNIAVQWLMNNKRIA
eukprot:357062-Chlamydomonas_euryale.AAC.2